MVLSEDATHSAASKLGLAQELASSLSTSSSLASAERGVTPVSPSANAEAGDRLITAEVAVRRMSNTTLNAKCPAPAASKSTTGVHVDSTSPNRGNRQSSNQATAKAQKASRTGAASPSRFEESRAESAATPAKSMSVRSAFATAMTFMKKEATTSSETRAAPRKSQLLPHSVTLTAMDTTEVQAPPTASPTASRLALPKCLKLPPQQALQSAKSCGASRLAFHTCAQTAKVSSKPSAAGSSSSCTRSARKSSKIT
mmetsp:Transcript_62506/g.179288  ORF Transcript_62506/g.179288 Transcript_62506/m.179288 type:complete len:256 (+) Transcript_62506:63-830(+)